MRQAKPAIEVGADSHFTPEAKQYDAQRQGHVEDFATDND
jgi:hypothetical protein